MKKCGAVISGRHMWAKRNDGREFAGYIESVRALTKGTLVVIQSWDDRRECRKYSSVYLEGLVEWQTCEDADTFATIFA